MVQVDFAYSHVNNIFCRYSLTVILVVFLNYGGWIVPFCVFVAKGRHAKGRKDAMRKDDTPCKNIMRKDKITPGEKTK